MSKQPNYGFPCVEDPNDFIPDGESCSSEELESHRAACANFGTPNYVPNKGCFSQYDESGKLVLRVTRTSWGIGTNLVVGCDGCNMPAFGDPLTTCHECGGYQEFCEDCWPIHEKKHDEGELA